MSPSGFRYFRALDGVRALAIALVLSCHSLDPFFRAEGGAVGVNVFFTLSGFLITGLLLTELDVAGSIRLGDFYLRRALRLVPALLLLLVLVAALPTLPGVLSRAVTIPAALLYVGNYVQAFSGWGSMGLLSHTWSLSVEEQFYLVWPLALVWLARTRRLERWLPRLILAFAVSRAVMAAVGVPAVGAWLPGDADQLLIGSLLAAMYLREGVGWARSQSVGLTAIAALLAIAAVGSVSRQGMEGPFANSGGATIAGAATACLIAHLVSSPNGLLGRLFATRPLVRLGQVSYGVYLFHYPLFGWIQSQRWSDRYETLAVEYALTALVTCFSWFVVERSALRLKQRIGTHGSRGVSSLKLDVQAPAAQPVA